MIVKVMKKTSSSVIVMIVDDEDRFQETRNECSLSMRKEDEGQFHEGSCDEESKERGRMSWG